MKQKNWCPFEYNGQILFIESISPLHVVQASGPALEGVISTHKLFLLLKTTCHLSTAGSVAVQRSAVVPQLSWFETCISSFFMSKRGKGFQSCELHHGCSYYLPECAIPRQCSFIRTCLDGRTIWWRSSQRKKRRHYCFSFWTRPSP